MDRRLFLSLEVACEFEGLRIGKLNAGFDRAARFLSNRIDMPVGGNFGGYVEHGRLAGGREGEVGRGFHLIGFRRAAERVVAAADGLQLGDRAAGNERGQNRERRQKSAVEFGESLHYLEIATGRGRSFRQQFIPSQDVNLAEGAETDQFTRASNTTRNRFYGEGGKDGRFRSFWVELYRSHHRRSGKTGRS